jgi:hypothetical protein
MASYETLALPTRRNTGEDAIPSRSVMAEAICLVIA